MRRATTDFVCVYCSCADCIHRLNAASTQFSKAGSQRHMTSHWGASSLGMQIISHSNVAGSLELVNDDARVDHIDRSSARHQQPKSTNVRLPSRSSVPVR